MSIKLSFGGFFFESIYSLKIYVPIGLPAVLVMVCDKGVPSVHGFYHY